MTASAPDVIGHYRHAQNETADRGDERRITQDDYDKKTRELKEQQAEIATRIEQHQQGNAEYRTTLESLISLASRAAELFEHSKTEQSGNSLPSSFRTCSSEEKS